LKKVDRKYSSAGKIHIVLDNATYEYSALVRDWLSRHKRIKLHYLPKSSPKMNLIERVWKFFNEKIRRERFYGTFAEACKGFFRKRTKWTKELRARLAENFQRLLPPQIHNRESTYRNRNARDDFMSRKTLPILAKMLAQTT